MKILRVLFSCILTIIIFIFGIKPALAFCGFYVAKADSSLYNQASQVIIARDGKRTVLTMSNDYQGEVKDFAMVVPVPVVLTEEQVHISEPKIIERLDTFSAPRLVEYFDPDPACPIYTPTSFTYQKENKQAAVLEYAWNMNWCDPCAADPLNQDELKQAGVFWLDDSSRNNVFMTRLHIRYNRDRFPEDLAFQPTSNKTNFQGRYIIRHPYTNEIGKTCAKEIDQLIEETDKFQNKEQLLRLVSQKYSESLTKRQEQQVQNLANLTGWNIKDIRNRVDYFRLKPIPWWRKIWN